MATVGTIGPQAVTEAAPKCCGSCPWRLDLQAEPTSTPIPAAERKGFYTPENREAMWWRYPGMPHVKDIAGMGDGMRMVCHGSGIAVDSLDSFNDANAERLIAANHIVAWVVSAGV